MGNSTLPFYHYHISKKDAESLGVLKVQMHGLIKWRKRMREEERGLTNCVDHAKLYKNLGRFNLQRKKGKN
jgi:hypothetical protein